MKSFFTFLLVVAKLYLGIKVLYWIVLKMYQPQLHNISEIDVYVVLLILDIWIGGQSVEIEKIEKP